MQELNTKVKYTQISSEFSKLINENIEDEDLKSVLMDFSYKSISEMDTSKFNTKDTHRSLYMNVDAFITVVSSMSLIKTINDLNWDFFCYIFNNQKLCLELVTSLVCKPTYPFLFKVTNRKRNNNSNFNRFYYYLYTFYRYVYDLNKYNNLDNIKEIGNYYDIFVTDSINSVALLKVIKESKKDFLEKYIYSVYPIGSRYNDIIVWSIPIDGWTTAQGKDRTFTLVNSNNFIKAVFDDFINDCANLECYMKTMKIFMHLFSESCNSKMPCSLIEFDDDLFEMQFNYYNNLDSMYTDELKKAQLAPTTLLLYFYRFLVDLSIRLDVAIGVSKQLQDAFQEKNFIKYYNLGYKFMYHNKFEDYPPYEKICLLPSIQSMNNASSTNNLSLYYDISEFNDKYKEDVKNFIWNADAGLSTIISYLPKIRYFLEVKEVFNSDVLDFNKSSEDCEFSTQFLTYYRSIIELDYPNPATQKTIFKVIRKYLNFYKDKYNVKKTHFDVLNLTKLDVKRDIVTITDHDIDILYTKFKELEKCNITRLQTLVFEIFIRTNLRIGSILNLTRDCLEYNYDETISLKYLSKTSKQEYIIQKINPSIAELIEEALNITKPFISNAKPNDNLSEYIFVHEYLFTRRNSLKRLDFYEYFKNVVSSVSKRLDRSDYYPYNIRHTYMTSTFKNGVKLGLKVNDLTAITGISYKTANFYYRNMEDTIELYVEAMSKVQFNDVNINGEILYREDENTAKTLPVKDDLGKCKTPNCILEIGECLACDSFVTFINRIPRFQDAIIDCDKKIQSTDNPLKKELYTRQKKLLAAYLSKMMRLSERRDS